MLNSVLPLEVVSPGGPNFAITADPQMPCIQLRAGIAEWDAKANKAAAFTWEVSLVHAHGGCAYMQAFNATKHEPIKAATTGGDWTIPFTQIRGGKLDITVTTTAKLANNLQVKLSVCSDGLRVIGSNPAMSTLSVAIPNDVLKMMVQQESNAQQFVSNGACPYYSEDSKGGVGLFQITNPRPTPDDIWNWRTNLASAVTLFKEKQAMAKAYPNQCRLSKTFKRLEQEFIDLQRISFTAQKKKAKPTATAAELTPPEFKVILPDYTEDELEDDTIRGFNGYSGVDNLATGRGQHEFEVPIKLEAQKQILDTTVDSDGKTFTLKWRRVPADQRDAKHGDPDYVNNIKKHRLF